MRFLRLFSTCTRSGIAQIPVLLLIILSAAIVVPVTVVVNQSNLDLRNRACTWECTATCGCGCSDYFDARPQCRQSAPSNPAPTNPPSGGCVSTGCTYYSCTQKLNTNSCGARVLATGFCQTNYPASDPCNIGTAPATNPPSNPTLPVPQTPPPGGTCPTGQWNQCGGCLAGKCVDSSKTCNTLIQQYCTQTTCGGDGVMLPAGQNCCSNLVLYSNGRCGPPTSACIGDGGSKPVSGGTCCDGLINCGSTCVAAGKSCPSGTTPVPTPRPTPRPIAIGSTCPPGGEFCACQGGQIPPGEECLIASNSTTGCTADGQCETKYCAPLVSGQTVRKCAVRPATPRPTPTPLPIAIGSTCPAGAGTCTCTGIGGTVPQGETCAKAQNSTCVNDFECESTYCNLANKCGPAPVTKRPGEVCNSTSDCRCQSTIVANGATCPTLANGGTCTNSNECTSRYCNDSNRCATRLTSISAGATCTVGAGCVCTSNGATISVGTLCPKKANYSACSSSAECTSGICTNFLCQPKPAGNVCTNINGCVFYIIK